MLNLKNFSTDNMSLTLDRRNEFNQIHTDVVAAIRNAPNGIGWTIGEALADVYSKYADQDIMKVLLTVTPNKGTIAAWKRAASRKRKLIREDKC